jgi:hypothetical protein
MCLGTPLPVKWNFGPKNHLSGSAACRELGGCLCGTLTPRSVSNLLESSPDEKYWCVNLPAGGSILPACCWSASECKNAFRSDGNNGLQGFDDPSGYNNTVVKVRGYVEVGFEHSLLTDEHCPEKVIWFAFGDGSGPPQVRAYVNGRGRAGGVDSEGRPTPPLDHHHGQRRKLCGADAILKVVSERGGVRRRSPF